MNARARRAIIAACALAGASIASGMMWYGMAVDGTNYARASWYMIPALWSMPLLVLAIIEEHRVVGASLLIFAALSASLYFSDVHGEVPGGVIIAVGLARLLDARPQRSGRAASRGVRT